MVIVKEKISTNIRINHIIFNDNPLNPKSLFSYILLKNYYKDNDIEYDNWKYYFIVRRHFLRKKKKENGGFWVCHYCGDVITKIQERNVRKLQKDCITVDHVVPVSNPNCDKLDTSNMVECCYNCNNEKAN
ncbi:MAG: HNH endonuclease, partial [bacterium]